MSPLLSSRFLRAARDRAAASHTRGSGTYQTGYETVCETDRYATDTPHMHTHAVDDMQVALRHSCRRQCLPYVGARFAQYAELLDPAESWEQGGFISPPMSRGAIPQVAREPRDQFESHHPA